MQAVDGAVNRIVANLARTTGHVAVATMGFVASVETTVLAIMVVAVGRKAPLKVMHTGLLKWWRRWTLKTHRRLGWHAMVEVLLAHWRTCHWQLIVKRYGCSHGWAQSSYLGWRRAEMVEAIRVNVWVLVRWLRGQTRWASHHSWITSSWHVVLHIGRQMGHVVAWG